MKPPMLHSVSKVTYTRSAYGDYVMSSTSTIKCHFRYINEIINTSTNESIQSDAMAWFEPDSGISTQDLIIFEDEYFRVEKVIKARKLRNSSVQFIKVYLLRYGVIS